MSAPPSHLMAQQGGSWKTLPANDKDSYCTVVRTRIGEHSIVMGAEVDCFEQVCNPLPLYSLHPYYMPMAS